MFSHFGGGYLFIYLFIYFAVWIGCYLPPSLPNLYFFCFIYSTVDSL